MIQEKIKSHRSGSVRNNGAYQERDDTHNRINILLKSQQNIMDSIKIEDLDDMASDDDFIIADAVHGQMIIPAVCKAVIDTYEFQRLRNITQCGIANYVYPTANHTRFEHSLGVCYYSRLFMECIIKRSEGLKDLDKLLSNKIQLCIQLAGLCHDLGHGPFSHTWEAFINKNNPNEKFKHEQMSKKIFKNIYENNHNVQRVFKNFNIEEKDVEFICDIITNEKKNSYPKNEQFLFEIIANKESGIDVDKLEYLKRDAWQFGMKFSVDVFRIFHNARIITNKGTNAIAYRDKIHGNIFDMFLTRARMHYLCYRHPKSICIEEMLIDALIESSKEDENKLSERQKNLKEYLKLDDSIINRLKGDKAQDLIDRIYSRDIYKLIHQDIIEKDDTIIIASIQENVLQKLNSTIQDEVKKNKPEIQIEKEIWFNSSIIKLDLGQAKRTDADPLKNVNFYDKENTLIEDYTKMEKSFASRFYSKDSHFTCVMIVIYCTLKDSEFNEYGLSLDHCQGMASSFIQERTKYKS